MINNSYSDPCKDYEELTEHWRRYNSGSNKYCDSPGSSGAHSSYNKWFRFTGSYGNRIYASEDGGCPNYNYCGSSSYSLWMMGPHPATSDGIVTRPLCYNRNNADCCNYSYSRYDVIKVRKCPGGYFVYYLPPSRYCYGTYCSAKTNNEPCLNSKCVYGCTKVSSSTYKCTCPPNQVPSSSKKDTCVLSCVEKNGGCSHKCTNGAKGPICSCPPNLVIGSDKTKCVDPCSIKHGGCSHFCINPDQFSGIRCGCPKNMILDNDEKTCVNAPCSIDNSNCSDICTIVNKLKYVCECSSGLVLKSDRHTCSANECDFNNGGCSHNCSRLTYTDGPTCNCPGGMELSANKKTCIFIDRCKSSPCSSNATCVSKNGNAECTCKMGYLGDGFTCRPEEPTDELTKKCDCSLHIEDANVNSGEKVFDMGTLIYGNTKIWISDINGTDNVLERFPGFHHGRVLKRALNRDISCLKILQECPFDCESVAKTISGKGLTSQYSHILPNGKKVKKPLGQLMCEKAFVEIPKPGRRIVAFYDPYDCGRPTSTHVFEGTLCCSLFSIGASQFVVWNAKCSAKVNVGDLISGY